MTIPGTDARTLLWRTGCLLLCVASLAWYFSIHWQLRLDAAQGDDFVDVLWFMEIFLSREHWLDQLASLTLPNHEHITLFNHLLFVLHYAIVKQVQFTHYTVAGHVIVLLTCATLARWLAQRMDSWLAATIAITVYVNLFYWDSMAWAITAISNQSVILFALLAAWSFHRKPDAIGWPLFWAIAATASQFNGLTVLFALALASVLHAWLHREPLPWRQASIWLLCGIVLFALYFAINNPLDPGASLVRQAMASEPENVDQYRRFVYNSSEAPPTHVFVMQVLEKSPPAFLASIGAVMLPDAQTTAAVLAGAVMLLLAVCALAQQRQHIDRFWLVTILFCLASIGMVALVRGSYLAAAVGMTSRYRMYSFLMLLVVLQPFLSTRWRTPVLCLLLLCGITTQLNSRQVVPAYERNREQVAVSYYRWLVDGGLGRSEMIFYPHNQDHRLFNAVKGHYYHPYSSVSARNKPLQIEKVEPSLCANRTTVIPPTALITAYSKKPSALATELQLPMRIPLQSAASPPRLLFCSEQQAIAITPGPYQLTTPDTEADHALFPLLVLKRDLPPGEYRVLLDNTPEPVTLLGDVKIR